VPGDIIQAIDAHSVRDAEDLADTLERYDIGDRVKVRFLREGRVREVVVMLE